MVLMHSDESVRINRNLIDIENGEDNVTSTSFGSQILRVLEERDSKWILGLITYNVVIIYYLCSWVTSTNSVALRAYVNTIFFNIFSLLVCLISIWVEQNSPENEKFHNDAKPKSIYGNSGSSVASKYPEYRTSFAVRLLHSCLKEDDYAESREGNNRDDNYVKNSEKLDTRIWNSKDFHRNSITVLGLEKYEVLALLVSSCLSLMAGSLVSVEIVNRLTDQPSIHTGRLGLGALLGILAHLGTIIVYPDAGLNHVVCKALPCPTLRGCNPILGGNVISAIILSSIHFVIHFWEIHIIDTAAAFAVIGLTATSMLPLAFYTLNVILQKLPRHMTEQLDKCIREALIIDGVLEFRNERFWTKSFGKLAGRLQVRIRRNANENHVLESVVQHLSMIVSSLTVQEFREPGTTKVSNDHPAEYYINELLPREENPRSHRHQDQSTLYEIHKDVKIMRIEDILGVLDSRVETLTVQSERFEKLSSLDRASEEGAISRSNKVVARTLTIYKNDDVRVKDHLYRGDPTNKNVILCGTKLDFERFQQFSIAEQKLIERSDLKNQKINS